MNKMLKVQKAGMSSLQDKVDQMGNDLKLTASDLDKLEQYGRRNNLEIHGIIMKVSTNGYLFVSL